MSAAERLPEEESLLRLSDVLKRVSISKTSWYRLIKNGEAPAPVHAGTTSLWRASAISAWIASLKA